METLVLTKQTFSYEKMGDQAFGVTLFLHLFQEAKPFLFSNDR